MSVYYYAQFSAEIREQSTFFGLLKNKKAKGALTTKLLSMGLDVRVMPSLILSFRSETLVRDILP